MPIAPRHPIFKPGLRWLLWLALLLPLAQLAAVRHSLSHAASDVGAASTQKAVHASHCDLCLAGSAVVGGAMKTQLQWLPVRVAHDETPRFGSTAVDSARTFSAYRSRAPPTASC